ncbi:T9SS type B sorting domain-containing protein [uncultured Algibacter sp.]|uniref:T9SS type B sorting domain-containing protein n=1 Tax=uncultured Algibacter sp. TaxID=298659 RepID=UPI003216B977
MIKILQILPFFVILNIFSQTCQTIDTQIDSSVPMRDVNNLIRVCKGDLITLNGSAVFSDNNVGALYTWELGNGDILTGTSVSFSYDQPGIYIVNLLINGTMPTRCDTSVNVSQVIQVSDRPNFDGTVAAKPVLCFGESTTITGLVTPVEVAFNCAPPVGTTTTLPDGEDRAYETSVFVDCYAPDLRLTSVDQIASICLNLEHSFIGDLDIEIISPNGQRVTMLSSSAGNSANLGTPWATAMIDGNSSNRTPGIGSQYCFLPDRSLPTLIEGIRSGGVFISGNGPDTYIDDFVPAGNYKSLFALDGLLGSPLNGEWKISITDNFAADNGNIFEWRIDFDSSILPSDFSVTPAISSEAWDTDPSIINVSGNIITVKPTVVGNHCYTYRVIDEFGCEYMQEVCIDMLKDVLIETLPENIFLCDLGANGEEVFDFSNNENLIRGMQPASEVEISYYATENDALNNSNRLTLPHTSNLPVKTIWVRIADITQTCFEITSFDIHVLDIPIANTPVPFELCDDNLDGNDTNGRVRFDLSLKIPEVLGSLNTSSFQVTFYGSQAEADLGALGTNITMPISNTTNPQTIYARVENRINTSCFDTTSFNLKVNPLPVTANSVILTQCDDDVDGISAFNLTEANSLISTNHINETFTYYTSNSDAETGLAANQIPNPIAYQNTIPRTGSTVFARVETSIGCYKVSRINLVVGTSQVPATFNAIQYFACDTKDVDNDNTNGIASFDFSDAEQTIRNLFPTPQNFTLTYYVNESDALAEISPIINISNYRNESSPFVQNIYVRIDSDDVNACIGLGQYITLNVSRLPENNSITNYIECSNTNVATYNLSTKTSEVIGTQTRPIVVSYHESELDAINNIAIPTPNAYTSTSGTTIYVRAQYDDNNNGILDNNECVSTEMSFNLETIPNPIVFTPDDIILCNNQLNTVYDLTIRENQITGGDTDITLSYYQSQTDLDNNNPITNPKNYSTAVANSTIKILATGLNMCAISSLDLQLNTIIFDALNINPLPLEECEVDNNGFDDFDLTRTESEILNGLNTVDFTFKYYQNKIDAEAGNSNFIINPSSFENTQSVTQTLYVRVTPAANICFQIAELPLIVNPVPEIQIAEKYVICLAPDDTIIAPESGAVLIDQIPIDTKLSNLDYSFEWYRGSEIVPANLILGENAPSFSPTDPGEYTVIATNLVSGCTIPASTTLIGSYPPESILTEVKTDAFSSNNIIEVTVTGNGEYEFRLDQGSWQESSTFQNVPGGEHIVSVRDVYNCNVLNSQSITIIDYPRFFTPNGDGIHDTWQISGISNQNNTKINIYDRFGKLLKQLNPNGSRGWDGTFNGDLLPADDYWFTVEFNDINQNNTRKIFKAHFTLKR